MKYSEILLEVSKDVLFNKNKDRVWTQYQKMNGPETTPEEFMEKLLSLDSDQRSFSHGQWLCNIFSFGRLKFEDMYKIKPALEKFDKVKPRLEKKDINQYKTLPELFQVLDQFNEENIKSNREKKSEEKEKIWQNIDIIYDSPTMGVYVPKTMEASCFLGKGTQWCTASTDDNYENNMFDNYNGDGPLYVIFIKNEKDKEGRLVKYQFHFESDQFMDIHDDELDIFQFVQKYPEIHKAFGQKKLDHALISKNWQYFLAVKNPDQDDFDVFAKAVHNKDSDQGGHWITLNHNMQRVLVDNLIENNLLTEKNMIDIVELPYCGLIIKYMWELDLRPSEKVINAAIENILATPGTQFNDLLFWIFEHNYGSEPEDDEDVPDLITRNPIILSDSTIKLILSHQATLSQLLQNKIPVSDENKLLALSKNPNDIAYIKQPSNKMISLALKKGAKIYSIKWNNLGRQPTEREMALALVGANAGSQSSPLITFYRYNFNVTPKLIYFAIRLNPRSIEYVPEQTEKMQLYAIDQFKNSYIHFSDLIDKLKNPSIAVQQKILDDHPDSIGFMKETPDESILEQLPEKYPKFLTSVKVEKWNIPEHIIDKTIYYGTYYDNNMNLQCPLQYGAHLSSLKNPTLKQQLIAVNKVPMAIRYIKNPSEEVQIAAVKKQPRIIKTYGHIITSDIARRIAEELLEKPSSAMEKINQRKEAYPRK